VNESPPTEVGFLRLSAVTFVLEDFDLSARQPGPLVAVRHFLDAARTVLLPPDGQRLREGHEALPVVTLLHDPHYHVVFPVADIIGEVG